MELKEMILQTLRAAGKPLNVSAIAALTGVDKKLISHALALMKRDGDIISPIRCKWAPNDKL
jgi:DNA-binding GntR family transcriptional regulator